MSDDLDPSRLAPRPLPRADVSISPIIWELSHLDLSPQLLSAASAAGANWFFIPESVAHDELERAATLLAELSLIIGIDTQQLLSRRSTPLEQRLAALRLSRCEAVMLQHAEITELKAGRPFHRLNQLRDSGRTRLAFVEAADAADAEWIIESSPAHAVSVPYGLRDQLVTYRAFKAAAEMGTALFARRTRHALWSVDQADDADVSFRAGEAAITSIIEPLPRDSAQLQHTLGAVARPMPDEERERWWAQFQAAVPAPPKPPRGHPPEYGT